MFFCMLWMYIFNIFRLLVLLVSLNVYLICWILSNLLCLLVWFWWFICIFCMVVWWIIRLYKFWFVFFWCWVMWWCVWIFVVWVSLKGCMIMVLVRLMIWFCCCSICDCSIWICCWFWLVFFLVFLYRCNCSSVCCNRM